MKYHHLNPEDELVKKIWEIMQYHKGYERRIARETLTFAATKSLTKNTDRKVRDALAELPVIWQDGYFIPVTQEEADAYIASMRSRQAAIGQRLRVLDGYLRQRREPEHAEQMKLMEV